jgi:hypothetical protein
LKEKEDDFARLEDLNEKTKTRYDGDDLGPVLDKEFDIRPESVKKLRAEEEI